MALDACRAAIQAAAGRDLTDQELAELYNQLKARARLIRQAQRAPTVADALKTAAEELGDEMKLTAVVEKRNAAMNAAKRAQAIHYVQTRWADRPAQGIEALLVGTKHARMGARASVAAEQHSMTGHYVGGLVTDIQALGPDHLALFTSGSMDRDVGRALFAIDNPDAPKFTGPKEAADLAGVLHKWQEIARNDANRAGAWVGKLPGYIVRQSHDATKIVSAGYAKWRDTILPRLDMTKTVADGADVEKFLRATYDSLVSGVHPSGEPGAKAAAFKGPANLAKKLSAERVLHFKDADAWADYNEMFGRGNLRESLLTGLERQAKSTALMRTFGTNPGHMLDALFQNVANRLRKEDPARAAKFQSDRRWLENRLAEVDGRTSIPVNATFARVAANVRAWESMAKLGGALVSSISDVYTYGSELRYQGRSLLAGMAEAFAGLTRGRGSEEQQHILSSLGVFFDTARGEISHRFSADDSVGGTMSRGMGLFFKLNGLSWWTDTMKASAGLSMSHHLALLRGKQWDGLHPDMQRVLGLYGLDSGKWDIIRQAETKAADSRHYLSPDAVSELPDEPFAKYLQDSPPAKGDVRMYHGGLPDAGWKGPLWFTSDKGAAEGWARRNPNMKVWYVDVPRDHPKVEPDYPEQIVGFNHHVSTELPGDIASKRRMLDSLSTPAKVRDLRTETVSQLRQYFADRVQSAVIEPDARTRATMRQGTQPGTVPGELLRFMGQFKSFPVAFIQRVVQREIYGRGADTLGQALRNGHGEAQGIAQMMLWTTLFGYGAMVAKDLLKGRTPRPPDDPKTWIAAASQGGGLGIYGDFLFGNANRMGGGIVGSAAGPVAGAGEDAADLWYRVRDGNDVAAQAFRTALNHTPFLNLFYTRPALDYLFLYRIQEALNPGSVRRMEQRVQRENNQTFLVRPSEYAR